jgi:hypothetical protein
VIMQAVDAVADHAGRVGLTLKADMRPGVSGGLTFKVAAVNRYLAEWTGSSSAPGRSTRIFRPETLIIEPRI